MKNRQIHLLSLAGMLAVSLSACGSISTPEKVVTPAVIIPTAALLAAAASPTALPITELPPTAVPLTATPTAAQATALPLEEAQVTDPALLLGVWQGIMFEDPVLQFFYPDGTYGVKWPDSNIWIARGVYRFEASHLIFEDSGPDPACQRGVWQVFLTSQRGAPLSMRFKLVEDACGDRAAFLTNQPLKWVEALPAGP